MVPPATPTAAQHETAQRLRIAVGRLSRRLRATDAGSGAGLTPARVSALLHADRSGPMRLSDLAASEGLNPTMLSRMIADFVDAGLVERTCDPDDRRSAWVITTPAGHALAAGMRRERTAAVEAAMAALPEAQRRVVENALPALEALAEKLAAAGAQRLAGAGARRLAGASAEHLMAASAEHVIAASAERLMAASAERPMAASAERPMAASAERTGEAGT
jgi:DNA-binding MarR family transcriptional regulator